MSSWLGLQGFTTVGLPRWTSKLSYPSSEVIDECLEIDFGEASKSESDLNETKKWLSGESQ